MAKQAFFVRYHGKGVTVADVKAMTFDELQAEAKLLHDQLTAESKAREEAIARSNARRR